MNSLYTVLVAASIWGSLLCSLTDYESQVIEHVRRSISLADLQISKLPEYVLKIQGMTSLKVKHLLNNLCMSPQSRYLEIGVFKGATFTAALHGNGEYVEEAVAIDNWSEFEKKQNFYRRTHPNETAFKKNCGRCLAGVNYKFYSENSFKIDVNKLFSKPVTIYFYDGNHSRESQELAFTYYNSILAPVCIVLVDDWNWSDVQEGTRSAFKKLGYTILFEKELPATFCGDKENWWNGLYVAVVRTQPTI